MEPDNTWELFPGQSLAAVRNAVVDADVTRAIITVLAATIAIVAGSIAMTQHRDP